MSKFEVRDKVKIVKVNDINRIYKGHLQGEVGVITNISLSRFEPYGVFFEDIEELKFFSEDEIEIFDSKHENVDKNYKETNPKDMASMNRVPLELIPSTIKGMLSVALYEGFRKYGKYNWRDAGCRYSVYISAMERHLDRFKEGENIDPESDLPHLVKIIAGATVLLDSILTVPEKNVDDRKNIHFNITDFYKDLEAKMDNLNDKYR